MRSRYTDENGVYLNKLGISDAGELKAAEYALTSRRMVELESGRVALQVEGFGLERLQAIHGHLFQDVYGWAGQIRTVPSSKRAENGMTSVFEAPEAISSKWITLAERANALASSRGVAFDELREQLVAVYVEANRIHAFPEGNGRTLQTFMKQLARTQRLDFDFTRTTGREWNLASAVSGAHGRLFERQYLIPEPTNNEPIRRIFATIVRQERAMAFEKLSEAEACARFPELQGAFDGLRAIEKMAQASVSDQPGKLDEYMQQVRTEFVKRLERGDQPDRGRLGDGAAERDADRST